MRITNGRTALGVMGALALAAALLSGSRAEAGYLVASGDSNIVNGLNGSDGIPTTAGNQTFFRNLLGGGSGVKILDTPLGDSVDGVNQNAVMNTFYNGQAGVTSSIVTGPITAALLAGTSLFIDDLPSTALTTPEVAALKGFLANGGSVFFLGEFAGFAAAQDAAINADLVSLGSSMSLPGAELDGSLFTATTANGQIVPGALTAGVNSFVYAATSAVTGGQALFLTTNKSAFIAAEAQPGATTVPEPSSVAMVSMALLGLAIGRRRPARVVAGRRG